MRGGGGGAYNKNLFCLQTDRPRRKGCYEIITFYGVHNIKKITKFYKCFNG